MKIQYDCLRNSDGSSAQHEEALRLFGELIGFRASRPDNELGVGPDVMWMDDDINYAIGFELKTKKQEPIKYNKEEIGQLHNHLQWMADGDLSEFRCEGLIVVGEVGVRTTVASPSDQMYLITPNALAARLADFTAKIRDTQGRTNLERWTALRDLGGLSEWQLPGWWGALASAPMKKLDVV